MTRPVTTLFMLSSVDGKISAGANDDHDFELVLPWFIGKDGLQQYYDIEKTTDDWCFITGKVLAKVIDKIGMPERKLPVTAVVLDSSHLSTRHLWHLCRRYAQVYIVTNSRRHPVHRCTALNIAPITYPADDFATLFDTLYSQYGCKRLTIQSGGITNSILFNQDLIDFINIVTAPVVVGGSSVPSLISGAQCMRPLTLLNVKMLFHGYVQTTYMVQHGTALQEREIYVEPPVDDFINDSLAICPKADKDVLKFIAKIYFHQGVQGAETIRRLFRAGYCYYFAQALQHAFNRGVLCIAAPTGHIVWVDGDPQTGIPYDIEGVHTGECQAYIPVSALGDALEDFLHIPGRDHYCDEKFVYQLLKEYI